MIIGATDIGTFSEGGEGGGGGGEGEREEVEGGGDFFLRLYILSFACSNVSPSNTN